LLRSFSVLALLAAVATGGLDTVALADPAARPAAVTAERRALGTQPSGEHFNVRSFPFTKIPLVRRYAPTNIRGYRSHPKDEDGVPMRDRSGVRFYSPTGVAWAGVELLAIYVRTGNQFAYDVAHACARKLRELMDRAGGSGWLPWTVPNGKNRLRPPWYNALSQGTALALFSRLYQLEHDPDDLKTANLLFKTFEQIGPRDDPWISQITRRGYLWFEHFAGGYHEHVLNAHMWATFGLYDYWLIAPSAASLRFLEGGVTTVRDKAHKFRRPGTYSWYCLVHKVAIAHYQGFHVHELRNMAVMTQTPYFAALADQFHEDYH
jgi:hypothetical protein